MARLFVKICGITNVEDALGGVEAGADALGFNFYPRSKRYVDPAAVCSWLGELPTTVRKIGILVDPTLAQAVQCAELPGIDALQLHGGESASFCSALADRGIDFSKAFDATSVGQRTAAGSFGARTIVLDSADSGVFGGSGRIFDWQLARTWIAELPAIRFIIAGGLTAANVGRAIREANPFGVDVTTGVEESPGRKDRKLMRAFVEAARAATA